MLGEGDILIADKGYDTNTEAVLKRTRSANSCLGGCTIVRQAGATSSIPRRMCYSGARWIISVASHPLLVSDASNQIRPTPSHIQG